MAKRVNDALADKTSKWESIKTELEDKIIELQVFKDASMSEYLSPIIEKVYKQIGKAEYPSSPNPSICLKIESLEEENSMLKAELCSRSEELETRTAERDLSTQAAEAASKQQLESIKNLVKIETECRRLQALARKSSNVSDKKSSASSIYVESQTNSQSESRELFIAPSCSDAWASALIAELDQFKNEKGTTRNLIACAVDIDIMDEFLERSDLLQYPSLRVKFLMLNLAVRKILQVVQKTQ